MKTQTKAKFYFANIKKTIYEKINLNETETK